MSSRIAHLQLLAEYNRWMNDRVYAAASRITPEEVARDRGAFFGSILGTLNHLVVADTLWLRRFARHPRAWPQIAPVLQLPVPASLDAVVFDKLPDLRQHRAKLDAWIVDWMGAVQDEDLDTPLHYSNSKGQPYRRELHGLLAHFFNHQTHHRGQASTLLTQAGANVGVTDLLALIPELA